MYVSLGAVTNVCAYKHIVLESSMNMRLFSSKMQVEHSMFQIQLENFKLVTIDDDHIKQSNKISSNLYYTKNASL